MTAVFGQLLFGFGKIIFFTSVIRESIFKWGCDFIHSVLWSNPMLPTSLTLRGHVAWDKFIL